MRDNRCRRLEFILYNLNSLSLQLSSTLSQCLTSCFMFEAPALSPLTKVKMRFFGSAIVSVEKKGKERSPRTEGREGKKRQGTKKSENDGPSVVKKKERVGSRSDSEDFVVFFPSRSTANFFPYALVSRTSQGRRRCLILLFGAANSARLLPSQDQRAGVGGRREEEQQRRAEEEKGGRGINFADDDGDASPGPSSARCWRRDPVLRSFGGRRRRSELVLGVFEGAGTISRRTGL